MSVFTVDHKGMAKIYRGRGLARMLFELISNAFDETVQHVYVALRWDAGRVHVVVSDDSPDGFQDLSHAWTLFAESRKKGDASKRGRFNFGEKWVLACFDSAEIISTKGSVRFDMRRGERVVSRSRTDAGSEFTGFVRATRDEYEKAKIQLRSIIPPASVQFMLDDNHIVAPKILLACEEVLPTVTTNDAGELVRTERMTRVELCAKQDSEAAMIYELGIPVMRLPAEDGDAYHINVNQKVPLSVDRDNVSPAYLRRLRSLVVNSMAEVFTETQASEQAVTQGLAEAGTAAIHAVLAKRYGEKRAVYDPSDREANNRLVGEGYTVIPPATFDKETWSAIREAKAAIPSGTISPSPKPYSEDGPTAKRYANPTEGMHCTAAYAEMLALEVCRVVVRVTFVDTSNGFAACCGLTGNHVNVQGVPLPEASLDFNVRRLGVKWFDVPPATTWEVDDLLLDEFGHFRESNHLSENYYHALREFGAKLGVLKLTRPEMFREFMGGVL